MKKFVIAGTGYTDAVQTFDPHCFGHLNYSCLGYIDDNTCNSSRDLTPFSYLGTFSDFIQFHSQSPLYAANLVAREPKVRGIVSNRLKDLGYLPFSLIHPFVYIPKSTTFGDFAYIENNVFIGSRVSLLDSCFIQFGSVIGHDSILGNNCIVSCNVSIGGGCKIMDDVFIGMSSRQNHFIFASKIFLSVAPPALA